MSKFHIHVYRVIAKVELEVENNSEREAKQAVLDWVESSTDKVPWTKPDCEHLAIAFLLRDDKFHSWLP